MQYLYQSLFLQLENSWLVLWLFYLKTNINPRNANSIDTIAATEINTFSELSIELNILIAIVIANSVIEIPFNDLIMAE